MRSRAWVFAGGMVLGTTAGWVLAQRRLAAHRRALFSPSPLRRLAALGYLAGENGTVVVLKNSPDYEELARNDMGESIIATPAIAGGRLFIRTRTQIVCVALMN